MRAILRVLTKLDLTKAYIFENLTKPDISWVFWVTKKGVSCLSGHTKKGVFTVFTVTKKDNEYSINTA